ncbi:MAG: thiamine ABC transporter substrate-binding protein [Flaviflexus sp.]|nr:thiamine ABC transporter substrate-binding protein [Flaviflexus sp.]
MKKSTALMAAIALTLTACSSGSEGEDAPSGAESTQAGGSDETGEAGGTVTIITHDSFNLDEDLIAEFEQSSGYTVETIAPGDGGVVTNQLILNKDNPQADAVYGIDNYLAKATLDGGVIDSFTPDNLPAGAEELDGKLIPIDKGDVCINVDHEWFAEKNMAEPETFEDLAKPEYAELLVVTNASTSSPGLAFLAATVAKFGEDHWQDFWTDLMDGGTRVAEGWSDAYYTDFSGSEGAGPYPLVLSYSSSPSAEVGDDGTARTGSLADTCTRQIEYAGVIAGAKNPAGAQAFIEFLLSDDVQASLPESMYMYPINDAIELPEAWAKHASLSDDPLMLDYEVLGDKRTEWLEEWSELTGR